MPKVLGYTPPWLSQPSPGARIFSDPEVQSPPSPSKRLPSARLTESVDEKQPLSGHSTIAHRGTEVFNAVGNKIRWADLARVKEHWEEQSKNKSAKDFDQASYRTLKTGIYYQITNLSVSPSGHFLAISTTHTVHVAILPDSTRLIDAQDAEIKLKIFQLGPTIHVVDEAALASVLWHPLAASTPGIDCLITVTTDSAVRVWEFDRTNHWSFESPALAIDLRKLADGESSDENFEPDGFGKNRGFSPDEFDMEIAAACFGGRALEHEDPWASMTLWIAMTNGDVYALCPLLPSKWLPTSTTMAALTISAVSGYATLPDEGLDPDERRTATQRYEWVQELDDCELPAKPNTRASGPVFSRPSLLGAVPRLQGPFELPADFDDEISDISNIYVIPANLDEEDVFSGEDDYELISSTQALPFTIICLTISDDNLHIMIETDGIIGQWLPRKGRSSFSAPTWQNGEFIYLESVKLGSSHGKPSFTFDPTSMYRVFVTTTASVVSISLEEWASKVGIEASGEAESEGILTRLRTACQTSIYTKQDVITDERANNEEALLHPLTTVILLEDIDLGTILLTASNGRAIAAQIDQTSFRTSQLVTNDASFSGSTRSPFRASQSLMQMVVAEPNMADHMPIRAPYAPSSTFYQNQMAPYNHLIVTIDPQQRHILKEHPIRLSPVCLNVMTQGHKIYSFQTSHLERAAAEVFRRCQILKEELADQVHQMVELADRLARLRTGEEFDDPSGTQQKASGATHSEQLSHRIEAATTRQKELFQRYERIRKKAGKVGRANQELSTREHAWIDETDSMAAYFERELEDDKDNSSSLTSRYETVKALTSELVADAKKLAPESNKDNSGSSGERPGSSSSTTNSPAIFRTSLRLSRADSSSSTSLPLRGSRYQREKIAQIMEMVQRQEAIIQAVRARLDGLGIKY